jgi:hypothetical protein
MLELYDFPSSRLISTHPKLGSSIIAMCLNVRIGWPLRITRGGRKYDVELSG